MTIDYRLLVPFYLQVNKVEQVVKKSMDTFMLFTMENELTCDQDHLMYIQIRQH